MFKDSSAKYYQNKTSKKSSWKIWKSFLRGKRKKQQYGCEQYKNLPENEKKMSSIEKSIINSEKYTLLYL